MSETRKAIDVPELIGQHKHWAKGLDLEAEVERIRQKTSRLSAMQRKVVPILLEIKKQKEAEAKAKAAEEVAAKAEQEVATKEAKS